MMLGGLAAVALTAIPFSGGLAVADVPAGIVLFGAAMIQVMVAVFLHGWGPNSVFPMVGAFRMAALALSVGIPFSLVLITTALPAESLSVGVIIESQQVLWNVLRQPLGLPIYLVTALGFAFWGPLGVADAEDLAGGTSVESSGAALLGWRVARAAVLVALAAMGAAAFLGGYLGPMLPGWLWMTLKTAVLAILMIWSGHRVARIRMELVVQAGWLVLLPLALVDVFVSGALTL
jgi:NADH-quinone oxidoreductase subunit H